MFIGVHEVFLLVSCLYAAVFAQMLSVTLTGADNLVRYHAFVRFYVTPDVSGLFSVGFLLVTRFIGLIKLATDLTDPISHC